MRFELAEYWIDHGLVSEIPPGTPPRWHNLLTKPSWDSEVYWAPAGEFWIAAGAYASDPEDKSKWVRWSEKYPERAAQLWPIIIRLIRRGGADDYADAALLLDLITSSKEDEFNQVFQEWKKHMKSIGHSY